MSTFSLENHLLSSFAWCGNLNHLFNVGRPCWSDFAVTVVWQLSPSSTTWRTPSQLKAFCSPSDVILRVSLGPDAWLISSVTLSSFTIGLWLYIWQPRLALGALWWEHACLMQIGWYPVSVLILSISPHSGTELSCPTRADAWKAISIMFKGHAKLLVTASVPLSLWTGD